MGKRTGVVRFLGEPEEMKGKSGSHVRLSIWALEWAPQSMSKPLGGVWEREKGKRKRRKNRRERDMVMVVE